MPSKSVAMCRVRIMGVYWCGVRDKWDEGFEVNRMQVMGQCRIWDEQGEGRTGCRLGAGHVMGRA